MQAASKALGTFDGTNHSLMGEQLRFEEGEDGRYLVVGEERFQIAHALGVTPLQQLVVELGDGHLQVPPIAWDSRPASQGGQRWFDLNDEPTDWTHRPYRGTYLCADSHVTAFDKGYDPATDTYQSTFRAEDVTCFACHGDQTEHMDATRRGDVPPGAAPPRIWSYADEASIAHLEAPGTPSKVDCLPCHSRRADLGPGAGSNFHDRYELALLEDGLYFPDGQIRDEVFVAGSFLQSRMYHAGVRCTDCHEPHSLKLKAPGNTLCAQCHRPQVFDTPQHHHHESGQCVDCHMPQRTYMKVDPRRDHRFGIPSPDPTSGPSPCSTCHDDPAKAWTQSTWSRAESDIVRATRVSNGLIRPDTAVGDLSPLVRRAAAEQGVGLSTLQRDSFRSIRTTATRVALEQGASLQMVPPSAVEELRVTSNYLADRADGRLGLALIARAARDPSLEEQHLRAAVSLEPDHADARMTLGLALVRASRMDEAMVELKIAAELDPTDPRYGWVYAVGLFEREPAAAIAVLEGLRKHNPTDERVQSTLAEYRAAIASGK